MKEKSENLRINISFNNNNQDMVLYSHLKKKRDKSNYIKDLIEADMVSDK
ncbi:MAG: hypothetical protein ACREVX_11555 [Clostridium sp.]